MNAAAGPTMHAPRGALMRALTGLAGALLLAAPALSQGYPARPIRFIAPFAPGGGSDIIARKLAQELGRALGQAVVVENRTGGSGVIGADATAKAPPDGYTIMMTTPTFTVNPGLMRKLPYDALRDFAGVTPLAVVPNVLVTAVAGNYKSVKDVIDAARARPGQLNYASVGIGTATYMNAEKFRIATGINAVHVPYKGSPEAITETVAGRVDYFFAPLVSALPMIKAGKLAALAVGTTRRSALLPDVPTLAEAGVAKSDYLFWVGMLVSSKTPRDIVTKINQATLRAMQAQDVRERFATLGADAMPLSAEQFDVLIRDELAANAEIIKAAGVKPE